MFHHTFRDLPKDIFFPPLFFFFFYVLSYLLNGGIHDDSVGTQVPARLRYKRNLLDSRLNL